MASKDKGIKRICLHWTAGYGRPNNEDMTHYHIMVDEKGNLIKGTHSIESNIDCKDGDYAEHCGGGNTGTIGIALCAMAGFKTSTRTCKASISIKQVEAMCKKVAELCVEYGIKITPSTVFTHGEFGLANPTTSSAGKIDIIYIPYLNLYGLNEVGDYLRGKVTWYYDKIKK